LAISVCGHAPPQVRQGFARSSRTTPRPADSPMDPLHWRSHRVLFLHCHGGIGIGLTHNPCFVSRAVCSSLANSVFLGAYFRYHQHQPFLTNMWMTLVPSGRCFTRWNRLVTIDPRDVHSLWSQSTHGRPVSVGTLYHHSGHTSDRVGDCAAPIYRLCALYVVVTAAAVGQRDKWQGRVRGSDDRAESWRAWGPRMEADCRRGTRQPQRLGLCPGLCPRPPIYHPRHPPQTNEATKNTL